MDYIDPRIYHEKQEGSLCAVHCLNTLLQQTYYTAVELSAIANELDDEERVAMAENGVDSTEYREFLKQPSGNMDDSGYFSIQVISGALKVFGLEPVSTTSTDERVKDCITDPCKMDAFICNYQSHWFTIRKIRDRWYNLNSMFSKPKPISDTYLSLLLAQLKNEGYSIFAILGTLPSCPADEPEVQVERLVDVRPQLQSIPSYETDPELQAAIQLSLSQEFSSLQTSTVDEEEDELQKAIRLSMTADLDREEQESVRRAIHSSLLN